MSDQELKTTEGEGVDFPVELLELVTGGMTTGYVSNDNETEKDLS